MTRPLTRKGEQTKARIVVSASAELRERGVEDVRLEDVMARAKVSKGQLFHYFPAGREALMLTVVEYEAEQVLADQEPFLSNLTSWSSWQRWRDALVTRYLEQGMMCPFSGLLGQAGQQAPAARAVVAELMTRWQARIAQGIRSMQEIDEISRDMDADRTASALLAGIQGGVTMMSVTGRTDHLEAALDLTIDSLRSSVPAS